MHQYFKGFKMQFKLKTITFALVASGILLNTNLAVADDAADLQALKKTIQELDQKIKILERKNEIADEEAVATKKATPVVVAGENGFSIKSPDNKFEYKLKGLVQLDYRTFNQATLRNGATNGFDARLIRPTFEGTVFGKYDFRFTPEFGESDVQSSGNNPTTGTLNNNKTRIVDAYVEGRFQPWLKIRVGKFTPYVGLERLQANQDTKWIERSYISNNITPTRDEGISVGGDVLDNKLNYAVGVYNGVVDGVESNTSTDGNNNKDIALRLFTTPFKDDVNALQGLGFGIAATYGTVNGTAAASNLPSYKTPGQQVNFFTYTNARATGTHLRIVPQAYYYYGPLGVIAEYASVEQTVAGTGVGNLNRKANLENDAWQVAVSYLLTGEDASYKGVKPKSPFDTGSKNGWGAWEILARYQENNIDDGAFGTTAANGYTNPAASAKSAKTWGLGVNWYLNQWVKVATNYEQTTFDGGAGTIANPLDRADERILFSRLQLSF